MTSIEAKQDELVQQFGMFSDWMEKYEYIIELGKELPEMNPDHKSDDKLIKGCQSRVWLNAESENGLVHFSADSDALITKGIISILVSVFDKEPANEVAEAKMDFIDQIGLKEHLSPTRANGLVSMIKQIKMYGVALSAVNK